jgi:hypothetical protein
MDEKTKDLKKEKRLQSLLANHFIQFRIVCLLECGKKEKEKEFHEVDEKSRGAKKTTVSVELTISSSY